MAQRAVVVTPTPTRQIGGHITGGKYVDVWVATTSHGSRTLRKLDRNMQVLATDVSGGTITLRATPQQVGRLIYASANDRLVVRPHR